MEHFTLLQLLDQIKHFNLQKILECGHKGVPIRYIKSLLTRNKKRLFRGLLIVKFNIASMQKYAHQRYDSHRAISLIQTCTFGTKKCSNIWWDCNEKNGLLYRCKGYMTIDIETGKQIRCNARYCSKRCQKKDWRFRHVRICNKNKIQLLENKHNHI